MLRKHVEFGARDGQNYIRLQLRKAKTARPGEIQIIHLQQQHHILDPVVALRRWLKRTMGRDPDTILFATMEHGELRPLTKTRFINGVGKFWGKASLGSWSGHSFRVGGASLRFNLRTLMEKIAKLGRWKSLTYLHYLKAYSQEDLEDTINLLDAIREPDWPTKMQLLR